MNDRQRLEAIVSVVCKYLPPDGISKDQAMTEIISLVDPLPEQEHVGEPVAWEGFTNFANPLGTRLIFTTKFEADEWLKDFVEGHAWLKPLSYTTPQPKQKQGEPVGEMQLSAIYEGMVVPVVSVELPVGTKLYTTPQPKQEQGEPDDLTIAYMSCLHRGKDLAQQRTWVGLTIKELQDIFNEPDLPEFVTESVRIIEAKLKEKNT